MWLFARSVRVDSRNKVLLGYRTIYFLIYVVFFLFFLQPLIIVIYGMNCAAGQSREYGENNSRSRHILCERSRLKTKFFFTFVCEWENCGIWTHSIYGTVCVCVRARASHRPIEHMKSTNCVRIKYLINYCQLKVLTLIKRLSFPLPPFFSLSSHSIQTPLPPSSSLTLSPIPFYAQN